MLWRRELGSRPDCPTLGGKVNDVVDPLHEKITLAVVVDRLDTLRVVIERMEQRQDARYSEVGQRIEAMERRLVSLETARTLLTTMIAPAWLVTTMLVTALVTAVLRVALGG